MHEFSICQSIVDAVLAKSRSLKPPVIRVSRATIVVGKLRALVPESLNFAYQELTRGTPAEGSELTISKAEGRELYLESMEVEQDDQP